jgi:protein TonB
LDFSGANSPVALAPPVPEDELWQKPFFKHRAVPPPLIEKKREPSLSPGPNLTTGNGTGPYRSLAEVSRLPHFLNQIKAVYPDAAKRANIEGVVILQVDIDATGAVKMVQLVQGLGYGCDEAALAAAQESTFSPAYAGEDPVPVRLRIPYRFKFDQ